MGKASKLLTIGVTDEKMLAWPEVVKLVEQGHTVCYLNHVTEDVVLGPNCWMMDAELKKYMPLAIRAARERKYGGKGVKHEVEDTLEKPEGGGEGGGVVEGAVGADDEGGGEVAGGDSGADGR